VIFGEKTAARLACVRDSLVKYVLVNLRKTKDLRDFHNMIKRSRRILRKLSLNTMIGFIFRFRF